MRQGRIIDNGVHEENCLSRELFKIGGSCIAGREITASGTFGSWIRPVGSSTTEEVSWSESLCSDNTQPKLLDIMDIQLLLIHRMVTKQRTTASMHRNDGRK